MWNRNQRILRYACVTRNTLIMKQRTSLGLETFPLWPLPAVTMESQAYQPFHTVRSYYSCHEKYIACRAWYFSYPLYSWFFFTFPIEPTHSYQGAVTSSDIFAGENWKLPDSMKFVFDRPSLQRHYPHHLPNLPYPFLFSSISRICLIFAYSPIHDAVSSPRIVILMISFLPSQLSLRRILVLL